MKRSNRNIAITALTALCLNGSFLISASGQPPLLPAGSANKGYSISAKAADAAPAGEGIWIPMTLAFSYDILRSIRKRENIPDELQMDDLKLDD